jgi:plastocyanin
LASAERVVFRPLAPSRDRIRALALPAAVVAGLLAVGCGARGNHADLVNGKTLFVQKCASCHTLARANAKGVQGPNLDAAFTVARQQGFGDSGIQGVVHDQISHVRRGSIMPLNLVRGDNARDVAAYVGFAAGLAGKDSGALAFQFGKATGTAGSVTLVMPNKASISHDISIKGNGVDQHGQVVGQGGTSKVTADLKPGTYEFYCSVPGHEAGGMKGTLTVK